MASVPDHDPSGAAAASVAVVGSTTIDCNVIGGRSFVKLGGVTTYAGLTYRRLGLETWVVSNVADTEAGIIAPLTSHGLRVLRGPTARTTRFVNRIAADGRRRQEIRACAAPLRFSQVEAIAHRVDSLHLGPLYPADIDVEVYERLPALNRPAALDVQGLVRRISRGRVIGGVSQRLAAALRASRIVKAAEDELRLILESWSCGVEEIMARCDIAEWVVTAGAGGGCIHTRKGRRYVYRSAKAPAAADPTGAGDVFLAAYAAARWGGRPPESAARAASAAAARHMAGGAIPSGLLDLPGLRPSRSPAGRNCVDNEPNER